MFPACLFFFTLFSVCFWSVFCAFPVCFLVVFCFLLDFCPFSVCFLPDSCPVCFVSGFSCQFPVRLLSVSSLFPVFCWVLAHFLSFSCPFPVCSLFSAGFLSTSWQFSACSQSLFCFLPVTCQFSVTCLFPVYFKSIYVFASNIKFLLLFVGFYQSLSFSTQLRVKSVSSRKYLHSVFWILRVLGTFFRLDKQQRSTVYLWCFNVKWWLLCVNIQTSFESLPAKEKNIYSNYLVDSWSDPEQHEGECSLQMWILWEVLLL